MEKLTLTRKEAAQLLGISTATVTQWVLEGRLKAYRVSDKAQVTVSVYERGLQGRLVSSGGRTNEAQGQRAKG